LQHRKWRFTLKQRMGLCLAAFFAAFAMQLALNGYQSRAVQAVQDAQMGSFNAISRFQGGVESSISVLENYRWENSETDELMERLQSASSTCNAWLWRIGTSLEELENVSDEQRVLYGAVDTVYQTYTGLLEELQSDLRSGDDAAASQLYYAKILPCGDYLPVPARSLSYRIHSRNTAAEIALSDRDRSRSIRAKRRKRRRGRFDRDCRHEGRRGDSP